MTSLSLSQIPTSSVQCRYGRALAAPPSFDNEELRRHHAVYKPGQGNWNGPFRDGNKWTWPGPPTEPYPPGFGES